MQKEKEFFSIIGNHFFFAFLLQFSFVTFFPIVSDLKVCFIDIDIIFFFFFIFIMSIYLLWLKLSFLLLFVWK